MVAIETVNYTFFIVGKFDLYYFLGFAYGAILGIFSTHWFKRLISGTALFGRSRSTVWIIALVSTLALSVWMTILTLIPPALGSLKALLAQLNLLNFLASVVNWMRYIGVWVIIYFMYHLLEHNNEIRQERLKMENLAQSVELELLKKQLNPHFLFNALNSIKALVNIDPEKSRDAIVKLSELLRFTLNYGLKPVVTLEEEMDEVRKYLELEKIRFGSRLKVIWEIEEKSKKLTIPPASVLTLVENAIKHGIAKHPGESVVRIKTSVMETDFGIEVANSGLLDQSDGEGIGLRYLKKRLENAYKGRSRFEIFQSDDLVIANIKIPG